VVQLVSDASETTPNRVRFGSELDPVPNGLVEKNEKAAIEVVDGEGRSEGVGLVGGGDEEVVGDGLFGEDVDHGDREVGGGGFFGLQSRAVASCRSRAKA